MSQASDGPKDDPYLPVRCRQSKKNLGGHQIFIVNITSLRFPYKDVLLVLRDP